MKEKKNFYEAKVLWFYGSISIRPLGFLSFSEARLEAATLLYRYPQIASVSLRLACHRRTIRKFTKISK